MRSPRSAVVTVAALLAGCGGGTTGPTPVTPTPAPAGPISGEYRLDIVPSATCPEMLGMPAAFDVEVDPQPGAPDDEVRLILAGGDETLGIELLLQDGGTSAGGGLGTQKAVPDGSGFFVFFRAGGMGTVTRAADGRGQILDGSMFGEIGVGLEEGDIGSQAYCIASDHEWTLRAR